jgi:glycosyltransferase involved in cell wall biosynthesis
MKTSWPKLILWNLMVALFLPLFVAAALLPSRKRTLLVWGSAPLKAYKYWSEAMREAGLPSVTLMANLYAINQRSDFDYYFEDFAPRALPRPLRFALGSCLALIHVLRRGAVLHTSYWGFALTLSAFWRLESFLLRLAGVKTVVIPFGADAYLYSRVVDTSLRYALLSSYPQLARMEVQTRARVEHWNRHADAVIATLMIDGLGRWDVTANQIFVIDTRVWSPRREYSTNDGRNGPVSVIHTPNHRGFKGTEFIVEAVERLCAEGLQVNLVLLERVPNEEVRSLLQGADILAEQFIATGYAMSGVEGMACGLPVMANLEHEAYTRVFRRYGFLNECPILSTTPETLVSNLRRLVEDPALRKDLGRAGRRYVEKYHSYAMARYLFGSIHDRLLRGKQVDLINLFHPLKSEYNRSSPVVAHPLVESRLPDAPDARGC